MVLSIVVNSRAHGLYTESCTQMYRLRRRWRAFVLVVVIVYSRARTTQRQRREDHGCRSFSVVSWIDDENVVIHIRPPLPPVIAALPPLRHSAVAKRLNACARARQGSVSREYNIIVVLDVSPRLCAR